MLTMREYARLLYQMYVEEGRWWQGMRRELTNQLLGQ